MVNVKHRRCQQPGCRRERLLPSADDPNSKNKPLYCSLHLAYQERGVDPRSCDLDLPTDLVPMPLSSSASASATAPASASAPRADGRSRSASSGSGGGGEGGTAAPRLKMPRRMSLSFAEDAGVLGSLDAAAAAVAGVGRKRGRSMGAFPEGDGHGHGHDHRFAEGESGVVSEQRLLQVKQQLLQQDRLYEAQQRRQQVGGGGGSGSGGSHNGASITPPTTTYLPTPPTPPMRGGAGAAYDSLSFGGLAVAHSDRVDRGRSRGFSGGSGFRAGAPGMSSASSSGMPMPMSVSTPGFASAPALVSSRAPISTVGGGGLANKPPPTEPPVHGPLQYTGSARGGISGGRGGPASSLAPVRLPGLSSSSISGLGWSSGSLSPSSMLPHPHPHPHPQTPLLPGISNFRRLSAAAGTVLSSAGAGSAGVTSASASASASSGADDRGEGGLGGFGGAWSGSSSSSSSSTVSITVSSIASAQEGYSKEGWEDRSGRRGGRRCPRPRPRPCSKPAARAAPCRHHRRKGLATGQTSGSCSLRAGAAVAVVRRAAEAVATAAAAAAAAAAAGGTVPAPAASPRPAASPFAGFISTPLYTFHPSGFVSGAGAPVAQERRGEEARSTLAQLSRAEAAALGAGLCDGEGGSGVDREVR